MLEDEVKARLAASDASHGDPTPRVCGAVSFSMRVCFLGSMLILQGGGRRFCLRAFDFVRRDGLLHLLHTPHYQWRDICLLD